MDSFGCFIKTEREKKGISLEEISTATKINPHILNALESDRVEELPAIAFVKGFISNYAKYIGLDPKEVICLYLEFRSHSDELIPYDGLDDKRQQGASKIGFDQNKILIRAKQINRKRIFSLFFILLFVIGIWFSWSIFLKYTQIPAQDTHHITTHPIILENRPPPQADEVKKIILEPSEPKPIPGALPFAGPDIQNQTKPQSNELEPRQELMITTLDKTWIEIGIDDNPTYDLILNPGEILNLKAQSHFFLLIGNAGGVEITYEGKSLGSLGKKGEVIRLRLPQ